MDRALTLAFTAFVLFQFFNVCNARAGRRSVCARETFTNWRLWLALGLVVLLQVPVVHWALAAAVAASLVVGDEWREAGVRLLSRDGAPR